MLAAATNKSVSKTLALGWLIKTVGEEIVGNLDFYSDLLKFNFNSRKNHNEYKEIKFHDLPPSVDKQISRIYVKLKNYTINEIFEILNIERTKQVRASPIEAKWTYHYIKKYGSITFSESKTIEDEEVLTPFSAADRLTYSIMF